MMISIITILITNMSFILEILTRIIVIISMINRVTCHQLSRTGLLKTF